MNRKNHSFQIKTTAFRSQTVIPQEDSSYNEDLMELIDKQYTKTPFYGVPRMVQHLRENGHKVNPKRIRRLYRKMDLHTIGPCPNTSKPHKGEGHA